MRKRGQITFFVVSGMLLIIVFVLVFFMTQTNLEKTGRSEIQSTLSLSVVRTNVETLVQECFENIAQQIIFSAGNYAGYSVFFMPDRETYSGLPFGGLTAEPTPTRIIVYLYAQGQKKLPNEIELEQTMEDALKYLLSYNSCLNDFNELRESGWNITGTDILTSADISSLGISIELSLPREFSKDGNSFQIDTFTFHSNINFFTYLTMADELISSITVTLSYLQSDLEQKVSNGEMTQEQAVDYARGEVNRILEEFTAKLDAEGYDFYYRDSPNILDNHIEPGTFFFITDRKTGFEFIFGGAI